MLTKNIYILFPPGYSGNYLSWAIEASDVDKAKTTILDPINRGTYAYGHYGGNGTSHLHLRFPSHQGITEHMIWMILNRPTDFRIYIVGVIEDTVSEALGFIFRMDRDPTVILIHDNDDADIRAYGNINCFSKWPLNPYHVKNIRKYPREMPPDYVNGFKEPIDFDNDYEMRNSIASGSFNLLRSCPPLNEKTNDTYRHHTVRSSVWFKVRNHYSPQEITSDQYLSFSELPYDKIFQLSCLDIASANFPELLENILLNSGCSDKFEMTRVRDFHQNYINAQDNLQWFDSIQQWRDTNQVDSYLCSKAYIQGYVIKEIFEKIGLVNYFPKVWMQFYNNVKADSWPSCDKEKDFFKLPQPIQDELIDQFGYNIQGAKLHQAFDGWEQMDLVEINQIYQELLLTINDK